MFPEFRPNLHVGDVTWDVGTPIHIWMDPGYAGGYALEAVQIINGWLELDSIDDYNKYTELFSKKTISEFIDLDV